LIVVRDADCAATGRRRTRPDEVPLVLLGTLCRFHAVKHQMGAASQWAAPWRSDRRPACLGTGWDIPRFGGQLSVPSGRTVRDWLYRTSRTRVLPRSNRVKICDS